jgi:hypothetical protein
VEFSLAAALEADVKLLKELELALCPKARLFMLTGYTDYH